MIASFLATVWYAAAGLFGYNFFTMIVLYLWDPAAGLRETHRSRLMVCLGTYVGIALTALIVFVGHEWCGGMTALMQFLSFWLLLFMWINNWYHVFRSISHPEVAREEAMMESGLRGYQGAEQMLARTQQYSTMTDRLADPSKRAGKEPIDKADEGLGVSVASFVIALVGAFVLSVAHGSVRNTFLRAGAVDVPALLAVLVGSAVMVIVAALSAAILRALVGRNVCLNMVLFWMLSLLTVFALCQSIWGFAGFNFLEGPTPISSLGQ